MDGTQWTQKLGMAKSTSDISDPCTTPPALLLEKRVMRPPKDQTLNCPRCNSTTIKFCYYNNYSLSQPRYFCKTCRRYWTEGGTLRNIPVGGGSRKHKSSLATAHDTSSPSLSMTTDQVPVSFQKSRCVPDPNPRSISHYSSRNPKIQHDHGQDLNLDFHYNDHHGVPRFLDFPENEGKDVISSSRPSSSSTPQLPALDFMRNGDRGLMINPFISNFSPSTNLGQANDALFGAHFPFRECKPSLDFSFDANNTNVSGYVNPNVPEENTNETLMFMLGATKPNSITSEDSDRQDKGSHENNSNGFWNVMLDGGSW